MAKIADSELSKVQRCNLYSFAANSWNDVVFGLCQRENTRRGLHHHVDSGVTLTFAFQAACAEYGERGMEVFKRQFTDGRLDPFANGCEKIYSRAVEKLMEMYKFHADPNAPCTELRALTLNT